MTSDPIIQFTTPYTTYLGDALICFEKHSTNTDTHTRKRTHPYAHTHAYPTPMSTSERLSRFDLEIHEIGHQERLTVDGHS
jgi:hypothetical protein